MAARKSAPRGAKPAPAQLMREALLLSLQREQGKRLKSRRRLQMVADALVDAAIKGEMAALREVFQRVDGKISEAQRGGEGDGPVDLEIRWLTEAEKMPGPETSAGGRRLLKTLVPYEPRPAFEPYHGRAQRWAIMVCHRRAGKTVATINDLILRIGHCKRKNPRGAYIAPLHKQAKDAAWDYLKDYGLTIPGAEARESELSLELPNGGRVRLYGADNPDALRGIYLDEVVLDEYAQMREGLWSEVIRPALADREGNATFIGTPMGRNAFASLWARAESDPAWFSLMLKASESGILPAAELAAARQEMSADQYAQEFECSFDAAVIGAYYAALIQQAEEEKRIGVVPWEPKLPVHTRLGSRHRGFDRHLVLPAERARDPGDRLPREQRRGAVALRRRAAGAQGQGLGLRRAYPAP